MYVCVWILVGIIIVYSGLGELGYEGAGNVVVYFGCCKVNK